MGQAARWRGRYCTGHAMRYYNFDWPNDERDRKR